MKIPIISRISENRKAKLINESELIKAQTKMLNERTFAMKQVRKESKKAIESIMSQVNKPTMSLNDELYGPANSPYNTDIWSQPSGTVRRRSRVAHSQSAPAQAMVGRFVDLVYGTHLELQAQPFFDLIEKSPVDTEEQQKIIKNIERRYWLYAKSVNSDYEKDKNLFTRSREEYEKLLIDGEYFLVLRYNKSRKRNPLTTQYIKPENVVRCGSNVQSGNTEVDGIEYNQKGIAVAYHILNEKADGKNSTSVRVPRYGIKSGRTFVIHVKIGNGKRGTGILAGIISEITKLSDFQALEIQAAVINALFAVWVETAIGGESKPVIPKTGISGISKQVDEKSASYSVSEFNAKMQTTDMQHGGVIAQQVGEGQKLHSFDTKRPNVNFENFYNCVLRNLASARGMSVAVMLYNFNGQYAAARGELLVLWNKIRTMRFDTVRQREDEIYKMWLWGEIDNGNVPNFGYSDEFIRDAFSNAEWTGPARPDIDPLKSVIAHKHEDEMGYKTSQQITAERGGGDYDENITRKKFENDKRVAANDSTVKQQKTSYSQTETKSLTKTEG